MKFNLLRMPLFSSAALAAAIAAMWALQGPWPRWVAAAILTINAWQVGRLTVRYALHAATTYLSIPLYTAVACGILQGTDYLEGTAAAFVLVQATCTLFKGYKNGYAIGTMFRTGIWFGLLPLLYAPALTLALMIIPAAMCMRRTLRETLIALTGALTPILATAYVFWCLGRDFHSLFLDRWAALLKPATLPLTQTLLSLPLLGLVLFGALVGAFLSAVPARSQSRRTRSILLYSALLLLALAATGIAPAASPALLLLVALPAAILFPQTLLLLPRVVSTPLLLLLLGGISANLLL